MRGSLTSVVDLDIDTFTLPASQSATQDIERETDTESVEFHDSSQKTTTKWDWNADFIPLHGPIDSHPLNNISQDEKQSQSEKSGISEASPEPSPSKYKTQV